MKELTDFEVRLDGLPAKGELPITGAFISTALEKLVMRDVLEKEDMAGESGILYAELYSDEEDGAFLRGRLKALLHVGCARCLNPVPIELDESLSITFLPKSQVPDDDEIVEGADISDESADLFAHDGQKIDMRPMLREHMILAVPMAPLCEEDCKGLCQQCGQDLNVGTCKCPKNVVDPRLAGLSKYKV